MSHAFLDRRDAGRLLAASPALTAYAGRDDVIVLALPRGGVPVAYELAAALDAPLDVFLVRKLGTPGREELAMGAVASGGVEVLNEEIVSTLGIPRAAIDAEVARERREMERREAAYRSGRPALRIRGRVAIVVDDGLATGASMRAAVRALERLGPSRTVVAVPVGAPSTCSSLAREVDLLICLRQPDPFRSVGEWYEDFSQTTDQEVRDLLGRRSAQEAAVHGAPP